MHLRLIYIVFFYSHLLKLYICLFVFPNIKIIFLKYLQICSMTQVSHDLNMIIQINDVNTLMGFEKQ